MLYDTVTLVIDTIAALLTGVLLLRFWTQVVRVRPPTSLGQFIYQSTDWLVRPLRKIIPGTGGIDWASLLGAFLVTILATLIHLSLVAGVSPKLLLLLSLVRLAQWICYGFTGLLIIEAIFSWVNPYAPLAPYVRALNAPLLSPLRRVIPPLGGIDLSPLVALILLRIALQLVETVLAALF